MTTHVVHLQLIQVDKTTGNILSKSNSKLNAYISRPGQITEFETELRVVENQSVSNSIGNPTVATYLTAEDTNGFTLLHIDQTTIVTTNIFTFSRGEAVSSEIIEGAKTRRIFGVRENIANTFSDISGLTSATIPIPTTPVSLELISSDVADVSPSGTGIRRVRIFGLDDNFNEQRADVDLNGTTVVSVPYTWMRINGSSNGAVGTISLRNIDDTPIYSQINPGRNSALECLYTVPEGKIGFLSSWVPSSGDSTAGQPVETQLIIVATCTWDLRTLISNTFVFQDTAIIQGGGLAIQFNNPLKFPARCDIKTIGRKIQSSGNVIANSALDIHIENA